MNLDDELRTALRRQDPSPGFAARVAAAVPVKPVRTPWWRRPMWSAAVAAALALAILGPLEYRRNQEEEAGRQAVVALKIVSEKLQQARSKVLKHTEN